MPNPILDSLGARLGLGFSGEWAGTLDYDYKFQVPVFLTVREENGKLSGTFAQWDSTKAGAISKVRTDGKQLTFEEPTGLTYAFTLSPWRLTGLVTRKNGGTEPVEMKMKRRFRSIVRQILQKRS